MSAPPRLLGLRLHGFKSFAERTVVEFGGGISAVVGPNGSGKSNLADALRWALGEQGRSLRTRKSEDVIFAGSERRAAIGMADVTLVLDNADGLLPVDYGVLEIGRRLYRSGENDYLLNKSRIRLRDLVDLLDAAHLADNAFLFIGQGMVDQALALRPDERRPLFEEVAGVRRHERRRRRAEEQLIEAEANLARVQDILAELRPQARRLAAQAEQQATRSSAGEELVRALLVGAHARWHDVAGRAAAAASRLAAVRTEADRASAALNGAETEATAIALTMGARTSAVAEARAAHDTAVAVVGDLRLEEARARAEIDAVARDRTRLDGERAAAEADLAAQRRIVAEPIPARDVEGEAELSTSERELAEALAELATLRAERTAAGEATAAIRRAAAARTAELETSRRRAAEATRRATEERARAQTTATRAAEEARRAEAAGIALSAATAAEASAHAAREAARVAAEAAEATRHRTAERAAADRARTADLEARSAALSGRLAEDEARPIARAARRVGGRRVDEGLDVEPGLRAAVETALGEVGRGYLVDRPAVAALAAERGTLVVGPAGEPPGASTDPAGRREAALIERIVALGGGRLGDAIRRDPSGAATRWLATATWVPDLAGLVEIQPHLPPGWFAVARDGSASAGPVAVTLGRADGVLERRVEASRLAADLATAKDEAARSAAEAEVALQAALDARAALDAAREAESRAGAARRRAEEDERAAGRSREALARESGWQSAQAARLEEEAARAAASAAEMEAALDDGGSGSGSVGSAGDDGAALAAWEQRAAELRLRRDRLAAGQLERERARRAVEDRRARAEALAAAAEVRIEEAEREMAMLADREGLARLALDGLERRLAAAREAEIASRATIDSMQAADSADRARLAAAEAATTAARDRLRSIQDRSRSAEVADLEARLGLEAIREGLLVDLASLGDLGLRGLRAGGALAAASAGPDAVPVMAEQPTAGDPSRSAVASGPAEADMAVDADEADETASLEAALARVAPFWAVTPPPPEPPSPARLASLRRRYHDLGAANPFAAEEYAEVRARLEGLEAQEHDLRSAIDDTRRLIDELSAMVAEQFRTTFRALETAFDERFRQLFGGGFARLTLTEPGDLATTGVEIVARPPGKKAQPLAMLSGGERALTAVALLFAMLEVRPVPFCVLDEVDAALDEANIGRFAEALRSLADRTQFIVITHNRGTIETADALYGVTVGEDSVSRVISLRLDEATAIAEGSAGERLPVAG